MVNNNPFDWNKQEANVLENLDPSFYEKSYIMHRVGGTLVAIAALSTSGALYAKYALGMKLTFTATVLSSSAVLVIAALGIYLIFNKSYIDSKVKNLIALQQNHYNGVLDYKIEQPIVRRFTKLIETELALTFINVSLYRPSLNDFSKKFEKMNSEKDVNLYEKLIAEYVVPAEITQFIAEVNKESTRIYYAHHDVMETITNKAPDTRVAIRELTADITELTWNKIAMKQAYQQSEVVNLEKSIATKKSERETLIQRCEQQEAAFKEKEAKHLKVLSENYSKKLSDFRERYISVASAPVLI